MYEMLTGQGAWKSVNMTNKCEPVFPWFRTYQYVANGIKDTHWHGATWSRQRSGITDTLTSTPNDRTMAKATLLDGCAAVDVLSTQRGATRTAIINY